MPVPWPALFPMSGMCCYPLPHSLTSVALMSFLVLPDPHKTTQVSFLHISASHSPYPWPGPQHILLKRSVSRLTAGHSAPRSWQAVDSLGICCTLRKQTTSSFSVFTKPLPRTPLTFLNQCAPLPSLCESPQVPTSPEKLVPQSLEAAHGL